MKRRHEARLCVKCSQDGPDLVALHVFNGCCGHLNASDHVAANDGQERNWISSDVRPELFLEYPKQVAFWQIHLKNRREPVIPDVGLRAHRHGERDKIVGRCIRA